ncbi:MAG TPA: glycosyltransferase family 39 protein, partial [Acidobacteriaceae bacterium]|nr:glycosyltransferase family 39 protein [Acidobacteriaceae bacterium]
MPRRAPDTTSAHLRLGPSAALAALLAALVLLVGLGHRPLTDWDEGIYAEIAREMLAAHTLHGFLIPHWNTHLWFEKPPLAMWLTGASLHLFGLDAFAARLPSALAGIAIVTVLHAWLLRRLPREGALLTAWFSTVILLSAFGFQHAARAGETDTLLSLFSLLAVLGLADLLLGHARGWLLFFTGFALAIMTKGAASVTLPLTALVLTALHPRHLLRHARTFTAGLLLFLALTVPWHAFVYASFGHAFLRDYLGFHTLTRATNAIEGHRTHPWFYL